MAYLTARVLFTFNFKGMRTFVGYTVLILCCTIYVVSCNQKLTAKLSKAKLNSNSIFGTDRWKYGDLYGMSNLSYFRKNFKPEKPVYSISCKSKKDVNLYVICDSYVWGFFNTEKVYCGVKKLHIIKINDKGRIDQKIDPSENNILLLECSERNIPALFGDSIYYNSLLADNKKSQEKPQVYKNTSNNNSFLNKLNALRTEVFNYIFNRNTNNNLEANVFDMSLFTSVKDFKADLNYALFKAHPKDVIVSQHQKQLYYQPTVYSFYPVTAGSLNGYVKGINAIYSQARKAGFKRVYFSIIPNPISVLETNVDGRSYNHLIDRIQASAELKMPYINAMPILKNMNNKAFNPSDSHWSQAGASAWLNLVNSRLETER